MKLVDQNTGRTIVEFKDHQVTFHSRHLERVLRGEGVRIPHIMQPEFDGKEVIFIDDPLFEKAFVEVYWPYYMATANNSYKWEK